MGEQKGILEIMYGGSYSTTSENPFLIFDEVHHGKIYP
ncbi:hypothetical protein Spirs_2572 [Sediminispirochaeta smaragdinae DSM 11293]|uniref:Uncharacterized protein n=1 Tax=Sediminispirochaeta smaragdinae (strain DSM 11293 / JCM 15392 / SEBR 4228) TaxID=573413 RepID=E1R4E1_SEDSS|nr:hypothetical protein Spirs_2572 [Sediminispirochaeta smaragdinae DSM 11293]